MLPSPDVLCVVIDKEVPEEEVDKALAERQASWIVPARYEQCPLPPDIIYPIDILCIYKTKKVESILDGATQW